MTGFALILAALQLAIPVRCYDTATAWEQHKHDTHAPTPALAFYMPDANEGSDPYIALGPRACRQVKQATAAGAWLLGHEFAHHWQDLHGLPFDEQQADELGAATQAGWRARLVVVFGVHPDPIVRLAP